MKRYGVLLFCLLPCLWGCAPIKFDMFPEDLRKVGADTAESVVDQAVWDDLFGRVRGHVNEPGIEQYATVELRRGARVVGVDGDIELSASGYGTQLPAGVRQSALDILADPRSPPEMQEWALSTLSWNRRNVQGYMPYSPAVTPIQPPTTGGAGSGSAPGG